MSQFVIAIAIYLEEDLRLFVLFVFRRKQRLGLTTKNSDVFYGYCYVVNC